MELELRRPYDGLPYLPASYPGDGIKYGLMPENEIHFIYLSIESKEGVKIAGYCDLGSWSNSIQIEEAMSQLPFLTTLLHIPPSYTPPIAPRHSEHIAKTLGAILGALRNTDTIQRLSNTSIPYRNRKAQVHSEAKSLLKAALNNMHEPAAAESLWKSIEVES
ncbi:hypothetical protein K469DRAFT_709466 [Zopfia rhizophila CBS 207.26]|uniref:Uncharacterized protein n=1 Tax=Zopfia rhizophila CBS 207.26 TaxID=1314779 RepID=A0A6A6ESP4_9PEZI|nr:hypothetical protein K469DRAFT_709466 [Zopfia rhizophila CBS 207.26]